jgi:hypothetical protein
MDSHKQSLESFTATSFHVKGARHSDGVTANLIEFPIFRPRSLRDFSRFVGGHLARLLSWYRY